MMIELHKDEYVNMVTKMIVNDFENSPYDFFHEYWKDHCIQYASLFKYDFWISLTDHLCSFIDIYGDREFD